MVAGTSKPVIRFSTSDIIPFVVFCWLRYQLTLRDLSEILLLRGFTVSHECVRQRSSTTSAVGGWCFLLS